MTDLPPVVLVNGAWHGAWCWPLVQQELAGRGLESTAVEVLGFGGLRGTSPAARGSRPFDPGAFASERSAVADLTLEQVRDQLVDDVRAIARGRRVAVVAHSVSGFVVAAAVQAAPELFDSIVYLAAIAPLLDLPAAAYNVEPEMEESLLISALVGDPQATGAARCDFQGQPDRTVEVFYHDVPVAYRLQAVSMLATDVPSGIDGVVRATPDGLGSVRRSYVHTEQDRAIPLAMQQRVVREVDQACGGRMPVRSMSSSHSPFLSQPALLAEHLVDLIGHHDA